MQASSETPLRSGFWEERTGWRPLKQLLFLEPLPGGSRWSAAFGSLLLFVFALQVVTGILLTTSYAPSVDSAWPSVNYIQTQVPLGVFVRALHHWGSSAMVILLLFHLVQVFVWGAYKKPRELTWMVGVLLLFGTLGLAFTGYLLPWDEKAYWATKVGLGMASTVPGIGDGLRTLLQGGPGMGNLTLTRFFTLHAFVLPGTLIVLVVVHLYLFRLHGVTPSWWVSADQLRAKEEPFWPKQVLKDAVLALVFLIGLGLWCAFVPAPLGLQADPAKPYEARPEWYFMFLFQLLRYFQGPYEVVGTFVLPLAFFLVLFFWPFLDRNPQRDPRRRPLAITLLGAGTVGLVGLTIVANVTDVRMPTALAKPREPVPSHPAGPIQRADVARIYNDTCAACHGVDGSARLVRAAMPKIPDFTSLAWQMSQTDFEIAHRIRDGNEPLMPAYRDKLNDSQQLALTVYVRAFAIGPVEPAAVAAPVGAPAAPPNPAPPAGTRPVAAEMPAELVYRNYCLACHDGDGRGTTVRKPMPEIPDFTDVKWGSSRTDADLKQSILQGKGKFMLPMRDKLGLADAERMVAYVRAFRGGNQAVKVEPKPPPPPSVEPTVVPAPQAAVGERPALAPSAAGAARMSIASGMYRQYCLVCHGPAGRGADLRASMPTIPDFANRAWQSAARSPQLAASILEGKGTLMPSFRGRVNDDQAADLVAYVRAFGPEPVAEAPPDTDEFEKRFRKLQAEWDELQKQLHLLQPDRKP
jgi:quinol-cytochrome oxidoreductase complex cytochrome b subunit/mono/diheme cytochrome c family protein